MPPTRTTYHHGALRAELLRVSLRLIETEGIGAVSLRRVAREAGVSPGAPYHHFADRASLLAALAADGFVLLARDLAAARERAQAAGTPPVPALGELIGAYMDFAGRQPGYFRIMFRPELSAPDEHPEVEAVSTKAAGILESAVADCVRAGVVDAALAGNLALTIWGLAHGLASLWIEGQFPEHAGDPGALTAKVTVLLESVLR